ncbi:hypothetical protein [Streptomyces sp. KR80]|uniref:hypothetical protein n=1 Tax=Streptomyces sp. KR80 TaxID=3457426 RepID=UPI003FD35EE7
MTRTPSDGPGSGAQHLTARAAALRAAAGLPRPRHDAPTADSTAVGPTQRTVTPHAATPQAFGLHAQGGRRRRPVTGPIPVPGTGAQRAPGGPYEVRPAGATTDPMPRKSGTTGIFGATPHPAAAQVVGTYVHGYDPSARLPYPAHIPGMRPSHDTPAGGHQSATPIYDSLYAEYRRSFRALPGDRSGEEDLGFVFGRREQRGTWDGFGSWETRERQHRAGSPPALPPAQRDNRRQAP